MSGREIVLLSLLLAAVVLLCWQHCRIRRILQRLDRMLGQAVSGEFCEQNFDESMLSAVESRFAQYLAASSLSARHVQQEKQSIETLITDISHQIRTPVANIRLYAQLLSEQPLEEQGRVCVEALDSQTEKLQALIEALVKTSRLETGILALHPVMTGLAPIAARAVEQYLPRAKRRQQVLMLEPTAERAVCDPKWTEEALCNLLDNALKYTPEGGTVTVRVQAYEMFCRVDVSDTGPGIPEEEQASIFGRFYRGENAYTEQGVGIGLYLTRRIAEEQGGYLKVSSQPGKGSTFSIFLLRG